MTHELKCWPEYFGAILSGEKTFEIRKNDRGFKVGDELWLREFGEGGAGQGFVYTGRETRRTVSYVLDGEGHIGFGLVPGYCVLALTWP
jgi:hypothetical protein